VKRTLAAARLGATRALAEAKAIHAEDREMCRRIGKAGLSLVRPDVLTYCNAGALATAGVGTATAPLYEALGRGRAPRVYACETRPLLQGARLTAWELSRAGIDVTVLADGAAAGLLASGRVGSVFVGADRIAANGDAANKVGTLAVALAAKAHGVPFYVCAPRSTFDLATKLGTGIRIEERGGDEVLAPLGRRAAPPGVRAWNPAFDVTPARLVTAFVTDAGVLRPPFSAAIRRAFGAT
jgi:methylthioribose-1-phosphate isomerase